MTFPGWHQKGNLEASLLRRPELILTFIAEKMLKKVTIQINTVQFVYTVHTLLISQYRNFKKYSSSWFIEPKKHIFLTCKYFTELFIMVINPPSLWSNKCLQPRGVQTLLLRQKSCSIWLQLNISVQPQIKKVNSQSYSWSTCHLISHPPTQWAPFLFLSTAGKKKTTQL